jgi:ABC-type iron transport system FetAB ATPase subunit
LDQIGPADRINSDVANLSGDEPQRGSIARVGNSPLHLRMDEPMSALDEDAKLEVDSLIL